MPNLLETAAELDKLLDTGWADQTEIARDNVQFGEKKGQAYLESIFLPYTSRNVHIGAAQNERKRHTGVLHILIRTPINKGVGLAYSYAEQIQNIMDNQQPLPNLFTYVTEVRRAGDANDGWFTLIADVPFVSDEF